MSKNKQYVGIDMSKDLFDVSYPDGSHKIFENDKQGFRSFIQSLSGKVHYVMGTAFGVYYAMQESALTYDENYRSKNPGIN